jgi:hypothetical protein
MPFRNGLVARAGRARSAPGREAPVPPMGLRRSGVSRRSAARGRATLLSFSSRCPDVVRAEDRQAHATRYVEALVKSPRSLGSTSALA